MKNNNTKKLAQLTLKQNKIDRDVASYALRKLSRKGLVSYLNHLKVMVEKQTVKITSEQVLSESIKNKIKKIFPDKQVIFETDKIGSGIRIQIADTVVDFSIPSFINMIVTKLKTTN